MKSPAQPCEIDLAAARIVRAERQKATLSQEALAELAGLHRTYISLLERGRRSPTLATIEKIARALCMPPATLLRLIAEAASEPKVKRVASRGEETADKEPRDASSARAD